jgi:predicted metal-binding protein
MFQQLVESHSLHDKVEMRAQFCMKRCQKGVSVAIGSDIYSVSPENAKSFFDTTVLSLTK